MSREKLKVFCLRLFLTTILFFSLGTFKQGEAAEIPKVDFSLLEKVKEALIETNQYTETVQPDGYLDIKYDISQIPDAIKAYQDQIVSIDGYIISGGNLEDGFYCYLLAKNTWDWCCQGVAPTLFTSLILKTKESLTSINRYSKFTCSGILKLEVMEKEGNIIGMFSLEGDVINKASFKLRPVHFMVLVFGLFFIIVVGVIFGINFYQIKKEKSNTENKELSKMLINFQNLSIGYGKKIILSSLTLEIDKGSLWGIIGPNGAGKTTLIRTLMGIIKPLAGSLSVKNDMKIGYVKQRQFLDEMYPFSVFELVMMGRYHLLKSAKRPAQKDIDKVNEALQMTGIFDLKDCQVRALSGGQKQRALIARALSADPELIILDEPTNDMDLNGEEDVLNLIKKIHTETKAAVIIVSHLLPVVLNIAEEILFIKRDDQFDICKRNDLVENNHLQDFYNLPVKVLKKGEHYSVVMER